eukprot:scaffold1555_cov173-Amphora_coffeaeformis.AAC.24
MSTRSVCSVSTTREATNLNIAHEQQLPVSHEKASNQAIYLDSLFERYGGPNHGGGSLLPSGALCFFYTTVYWRNCCRYAHSSSKVLPKNPSSSWCCCCSNT